MLLGPGPARIRPRKAEFGLLRHYAAAGARLRRAPPPSALPSLLSRPIEDGRPRLDRALFRSEPPEPDPTVQNPRYQFGPSLLLKSPWTLCYSTRSPYQVKRSYSLAQKHARTPLSFSLLEPAIQAYCFCKLDPRVKV